MKLPQGKISQNMDVKSEQVGEWFKTFGPLELKQEGKIFFCATE